MAGQRGRVRSARVAARLLRPLRPRLTGALPSFRGMSSLQRAFLNDNDFDGIPGDFFDGGLTDLLEISLSNNQRLNASSGGWALPPGLADSAPQLQVLSLDNCSLSGGIPGFRGRLTGLQNLTLSYNNLSGPVPAALNSSGIQRLWLNNQRGDAKLSGTLDVTTLSDVKLSGNHLTGRVPDSLTKLASLQKLDLSMNDLNGPLHPFSPTVDVNVTSNLNFNTTAAPPDAQPNNSPRGSHSTPGATAGAGGNNAAIPGSGKKASSAVLLGTTIPVAVSVVALISVGAVFFCKRRASVPPQVASVVLHPRNSSDPDNLAKIVVATNDGSSGTSQGNTHSGSSSLTGDVHMIEAGNFVIAVQVPVRPGKAALPAKGVVAAGVEPKIPATWWLHLSARSRRLRVQVRHRVIGVEAAPWTPLPGREVANLR
ncbi:unnamed protein product [Miscanthus lutarioriparius]|uniref:Uncharacterized protein n=1 Tax=Miscanthus lutarioriparius TaxID=422564 RepID=A0A811QH04_9POAL|nr:unnamed protein product [Miscanthus lutarioriparius]